ncbi:MAG: hypothetical protein DMD95_14115 [Candidatus Rokuibacteriota bacterium]|nr:MAG: hypothetical protein DMD95_14115 [Candidatus Rokubacteria bacterium]
MLPSTATSSFSASASSRSPRSTRSGRRPARRSSTWSGRPIRSGPSRPTSSRSSRRWWSRDGPRRPSPAMAARCCSCWCSPWRPSSSSWCRCPWRRAAGDGDRGLDGALAAPARPRPVLRLPPHQLHLRAGPGRRDLRRVQPQVHAARPLRAQPLRGRRADVRPSDRAGARHHARQRGAPLMATAPEQPLRITPDMLLSRRIDFERRMRRLPPVTVVILVVLVVIFLAEVRVGALASREAIVAMGALERERVAAGEYWRLLTAPWLHGGVDHLVGNGIALFILGMLCEAAFGHAQFVLLYVLSGLAGSLVSLAVSVGPSVGASGAIFGLQGAAIMLFRLHRDRLLVRDWLWLVAALLAAALVGWSTRR